MAERIDFKVFIDSIKQELYNPDLDEILKNTPKKPNLLGKIFSNEGEYDYVFRNYSLETKSNVLINFSYYHDKTVDVNSVRGTTFFDLAGQTGNYPDKKVKIIKNPFMLLGEQIARNHNLKLVNTRRYDFNAGLKKTEEVFCKFEDNGVNNNNFKTVIKKVSSAQEKLELKLNDIAKFYYKGY